jgi:hypothetical protein
MAIRRSTGLRTAILNGVASTGGTVGLRGILDGGVLDIFTGSQPASADYVETGTKLLRISSTQGTTVTDGLRFGTAAAGVLPLTTPAWQGLVTVAGVAGWARFYGTGATSGTSATERRFDMSVGVSGADLNLSHTSLSLNEVQTILTFNITEPSE